MILVDSSIWIDHLRQTNDRLVALLDDTAVLTHPFVVGELALGSLRDRAKVIGALSDLPLALAASDEEVLGLIERRALHTRGLGYIDAHLIASTMLTKGAQLWTRDKRLEAAANELGISAAEAVN